MIDFNVDRIKTKEKIGISERRELVLLIKSWMNKYGLTEHELLEETIALVNCQCYLLGISTVFVKQ